MRKNLSFFANRFRLWKKTWKNSNFQSLNILLENSFLFANRFRVWDNLNYLRSRVWPACLKNSTLPRTVSFYRIICYISEYQSSKSKLKKLKTYTFLLTDSVIYITWNISKNRSSNCLLKNLSFLANRFRLWKSWKSSNFQSPNRMLRNFILFANRFRVRDNLNYWRFRARLVCLNNSILPQTELCYKITS